MIANLSFSAYLAANLHFGDEHRFLSALAPRVPMSESIGDAVVCGFAWARGIECAELPPEFAKLAGVAEYAGMIRYLCRGQPGANNFACADKALVGVCGALILLASGAIAVVALTEVWRLRDRDVVRAYAIYYGAGAIVLVLLSWFSARGQGTYFWIGRIGDPLMQGRPLLGLTGVVIGCGLLLILAVSALIIAGASTHRLIRWRRSANPAA